MGVDVRRNPEKGRLALAGRAREPVQDFDVVEVIIANDAKPRVELIKNAFPLSKPYLY